MPIKYDDKGAVKRPGEPIEFDREKIMHFTESAKSVKYFAEHFFYIIHATTGRQLIELREYQNRILDGFQNNKFNILLAARQSGKTSSAAIYILWFALFNKDKTIAILANKAETAKSILAEIKFAYEHLPPYLKPGVLEYNTFSVVFENGCKIFAKATSADALRGESISLLFCDEFAFVPQNIADDFWTANYPTLSTGGSCIIVSTPNGTANLFYKHWKDAIDKRNTFNPMRIDWWEVPGRDEKWKDEQVRNLGKIKFNQEFGNQFQGSSVTLIDAEFITQHLKWEEPVLAPDDFTKIWDQPKPGHKYLISVDTAGGVGSDNSVMNVFDITYYPERPAEQVAIWVSNAITPPKFSEMVYDAAIHWNKAYIIGEINGLSNEVLSRIMEMEYEQVYFDYDDETYGVYSTKSSKPKAAMWFKEELEGQRIKLKDNATIDEIGYFEEVSPGVYKAKTGRNNHDDRVITCMWTAYFLKSKYFVDEKESWAIKINPETGEAAEEYDTQSEEALQAFLDADKKQHGENWLDNDEMEH
jgi:hypothetical protein